MGSYRQTAVFGPYSPATTFMCSTDRLPSDLSQLFEIIEVERVRGNGREHDGVVPPDCCLRPVLSGDDLHVLNRSFAIYEREFERSGVAVDRILDHVRKALLPNLW